MKKSTKWNGMLQRSVHMRAKSFCSAPFHFTAHFSQPSSFRNGIERSRRSRVNTCKNSFVFWNSSISFRSVPFSCEQGLSLMSWKTPTISYLSPPHYPTTINRSKLHSLSFRQICGPQILDLCLSCYLPTPNTDLT